MHAHGRFDALGTDDVLTHIEPQWKEKKMEKEGRYKIEREKRDR